MGVEAWAAIAIFCFVNFTMLLLFFDGEQEQKRRDRDGEDLDD